MIDDYRQDGSVVDEPLGASAFEALGLPSAVPEGALVDFSPISVLTTASLRQLRAFVPDCDWDVRRFRMNVIIETAEPDHARLGGTLQVGDPIRRQPAARLVA